MFSFSFAKDVFSYETERRNESVLVSSSPGYLVWFKFSCTFAPQTCHTLVRWCKKPFSPLLRWILHLRWDGIVRTSRCWAVAGHGRLEPAGKLPGGSAGTLHLYWQSATLMQTHDARLHVCQSDASLTSSAHERPTCTRSKYNINTISKSSCLYPEHPSIFHKISKYKNLFVYILQPYRKS